VAINAPQRIVLALYCLLLLYCCVWIPWYIGRPDDYLRAGYGWVWAGPSKVGPLAAPDLPLIFLRIMAATSISAAVFLLTGLWKSATRH
jgi:hypothetical protein